MITSTLTFLAPPPLVVAGVVDVDDDWPATPLIELDVEELGILDVDDDDDEYDESNVISSLFIFDGGVLGGVC